MRTSRQIKHKRNPLPVVYRLTRRTTLFLALFQIALLLFFVFGNYQQFLDSSQSLILKLSGFTSTALIVFSLALFLESIIYNLKTNVKIIKKYTRIYIFLSILAFIYGILTLIISRTIDIISMGIN